MRTEGRAGAGRSWLKWRDGSAGIDNQCRGQARPLLCSVATRSGGALRVVGHSIGLRSLIDANDLKPPYTIFPGQKLSLPSSGVHVVRRAKPSIKSRLNTNASREHWFGSAEISPPTFTPGKRSPCLEARRVRHQQHRKRYRPNRCWIA